MSRIEGRIARLRDQMAKLEMKLVDYPDDARGKIWRDRWTECRQSLANIRDHGRETLSEMVGVDIDVPVAGFGLEG